MAGFRSVSASAVTDTSIDGGTRSTAKRPSMSLSRDSRIEALSDDEQRWLEDFLEKLPEAARLDLKDVTLDLVVDQGIEWMRSREGLLLRSAEEVAAL